MRFKRIFSFVLSLLLFLIIFSYFYSPPRAKTVTFGVVFSQKHASLLGLDWKKAYLSILDDLKAKHLKILTHWDLLEPKNNFFQFSDLDWQLKEAEKRNVKVILVLGMKTGRWPECHLPEWAKELSAAEREKEILDLVKTLILRYRSFYNISGWQIENEPLFPFGECPKITKDFLKKEIELAKSLDPRPVIFADSGEFSFWISASKLGDIVSATLHRRVYFREFSIYVTYPFPPSYYYFKSKIVEKFFKKKVIIGELQAEPWCKNLLYNCPPEEQKITMDLEKFRKNLEFAQKTGLDTFYLWGGEWWYWLKERGEDEIWEEAKKFFTKN